MDAKPLHLTTCPYCNGGGGEICVDLERVAQGRDYEEDDVLRADLLPEQSPFVMSSDQLSPGPCKHLLFLSGHFYYQGLDKRRARSGRTWAFTCDWWHPTVDRLDDDLESFVVQLTNEVILLPGGDVPFGIEWFSKKWPDQRYGGWPSCRYGVDARAVFCRDVTAFLTELWLKNDRYTAWWNGDDPLGAGLFVEGFTAEQLGGPAPVRVVPACQAVNHADNQDGCCEDEYYDEDDYSESDADDEA